MRSWLGIDVGTSAVKADLVDDDERVVAEATVPLSTIRLKPGWSEQDPDDWEGAVEEAITSLARSAPDAFRTAAGIGLSGQMHAALLLGADDRPLRPAILWNDGRAEAEAAELAGLYPELADRLGVRPMAGFTAPKIRWLHNHEPGVVDKAATILQPKDYVRLRLTGERLTDVSDAAGTWLFDQDRRAWSNDALAAAGLQASQMPPALESNCKAGRLRDDVARRWGLDRGIPVAAGAGDTPAGGVGIGVIEDGAAFFSLGTSSQLFVATDEYRPATATLVHAFCHAVPRRWYQMAAMLNGASVMAWAAGLLGTDVSALVAEVEAADRGPSSLIMLPYLTGERTPHDDPHARGVIFGLTPATDRVELARAVMEGVAYTFADAKAALAASGTKVSHVGVIGGGARSRLWSRIVASVTGATVLRYSGAERGASFGAARLARMAVDGTDPARIAVPPPVAEEIRPDPALAAAYAERIEKFRRLYQALAFEFRPD